MTNMETVIKNHNKKLTNNIKKNKDESAERNKMPPRKRRMQGRKRHLPSNNKNRKLIKNTHWTKFKPTKKIYSNTKYHNQ